MDVAWMMAAATAGVVLVLVILSVGATRVDDWLPEACTLAGSHRRLSRHSRVSWFEDGPLPMPVVTTEMDSTPGKSGPKPDGTTVAVFTTADYRDAG
ncbi:MAG: hypothetical protein ACRDD1_03530 [Planctomycetia bacterium]